jgi:hypothetical protein
MALHIGQERSDPQARPAATDGAVAQCMDQCRSAQQQVRNGERGPNFYRFEDTVRITGEDMESSHETLRPGYSRFR